MSLTPAAIIERRKGIGASDAIKIMGSDEDRYNLWLDKTGRREPDDLSKVWPVQLGVATEALNLSWYEIRTGRPLSRLQEVVISDEYPFMRCTLDGFDASLPAIVQAKHVNGFTKLIDCVEKYTPQCVHEMVVTQAPHGFLSVIIGSNEPVLAEIEYDEFYAMQYVDRCVAFWRHVAEDTEPAGAPPPVAPPIPREKMRKVSMVGNNEWGAFAADWLSSQKAAKTFDAAVKGIKGLVEPDVCEAVGHGLKVIRDGCGIKIGEG